MDTQQQSVEQTSAARGTIVVQPGEGEVLHAFGDTVQVKLGGSQTNGSLVVALDSTPAGAGPPPHIHHNEDEVFIIVEGSYRFLKDDQWTDVIGPGTVIYTPRGVRHTFRNVGDTPCKHWIITTPSGFEKFFASCAAVFAIPGPPDMAQILSISDQHGLEFVPPLGGPPPEST